MNEHNAFIQRTSSPLIVGLTFSLEELTFWWALIMIRLIILFICTVHWVSWRLAPVKLTFTIGLFYFILCLSYIFCNYFFFFFNAGNFSDWYNLEKLQRRRIYYSFFFFVVIRTLAKSPWRLDLRQSCDIFFSAFSLLLYFVSAIFFFLRRLHQSCR